MQYYAITEQGTNRSENQDVYLIEKKGDCMLFAIADGVGGLAHGATASKTAIQSLQTTMQTTDTIDLKIELEKANQSVLFQGEKQKTEMATTLVACLLDKETGKSTITHVGDSRAYVIDDNIWRTKDHTLVQDLVEMGIISPNQATAHPERHRMTQAVGIKNRLDIQMNHKLLKDSILLLCSDGLSDHVGDRELAAIARQYDPETACKKLISKARENGSTDDITIIIAHMKE